MLRVAEQAYRSDTGRQRSANEDSFFARAPVFAVADGMGGAQAGEVASRLATEAFEAGDDSGRPPESYLKAVAEAANARIHEFSRGDSSRSGMGTTLTAALVHGEELSLAHVGDSRAYLLRDGELRRLTSDHSLVEELRRQGRLTEQQASEHPQRSIITRALGPEPTVDVDTMSYPIRAGDVVLLCSDGLTTMLSEAEIAQVLMAASDLDRAVSRLVREANEAGGRDNITVVAFRLEEVGAPASAAADSLAAEGATLVGPSAAAAGLTAEAVRERAGSTSRAEQAEPSEQGPPRAERTAPRDRPRRGRTIAKALLGLAAVAAIVGGAIYGARQIYFLGGDESGRLAVFRGLPYELPFDIELYSEVHSSPVQVDSVPAARRESATDHELRSRDDAISLFEDLEQAALAAEPDPDGARPRGGAGPQSGGGADREGQGGDQRSGGGG